MHTHAPEARAAEGSEVAVDSEAVGSGAVGWAAVEVVKGVVDAE